MAVSTVQHRQQINAEKGEDLDTLDYSKLGAGDSETDDGFSALKMATVCFSATCPILPYAQVTTQ